MAYRKVTRRSWFSRLGNSVTGAVFGLLLVLASIIGLFVNEGRAVKTARALSEGAGVVVEVPAAAPDPANDGKLVHVAGTLTPDETPADNAFGLSVPGAIRLLRMVEMYQWKENTKTETRTKLGGGEETVRTYTYERTWADGRIDSGRFKQPAGHQNPEPRTSRRHIVVSGAALEGFRLASSQLETLGRLQQVSAPPGAVDAAARTLSLPVYSLQRIDGVIHTGTPEAPEIGDLRIDWQAALVPQASVIARQQGNGFTPYTTSNGRELFISRAAITDPQAMFAEEQSANTTLTWILRVAWLVAMFIGFSLILSIFGVAADIIPLAGRLVRLGTGLFALVMTLAIGPIVIALGWVYFRPLLAAIIIAIGLAAALGLFRLGEKRVQAPEANNPV